MNKLVFLFSMFTLALAGCSSDSGSPVPGTNIPDVKTITISGYLIDPPISNAKIELQLADGTLLSGCGVNGNTVCLTWTGSSGNFSMKIKDNVELSNAYLISYGGTDNGYGIDFYGVSFNAPMRLYSANSDGDYENIIITPVTSMLKPYLDASMSVADASAKVINALGLPEGTNVRNSPLSNTDILKASYMVTKTVLLKKDEGSAAPVQDVAQAIKDEDDTLTSSAVLGGLFPGNAYAVESIHEAEVIVADAHGNSSDDIVSAIKTGEKHSIFKKALLAQIGDWPADPSKNAENNILSLFNFLETQADKDIPLSDLALKQLARFVVHCNSVFTTYATYDKSSYNFKSSASSVLNSSFAPAQLAAIPTESVYYVEIPAEAVLGKTDNQKRVNYYFNSNADINYIARNIMSKAKDDSYNDKIITAVSNNYAKYGMHDRAETLARTYIAEPLTLADTYISMAIATYKSSPNAAIKYLIAGQIVLDSIAENSTLDSSLLGSYVDLMKYYDVLGENAKATSLRTFVMAGLEAMPAESEPDQVIRNSLIGSVLSAMADVAVDLASEGNLDQAMVYADYVVANIGKYEGYISSNYVMYDNHMVCLTTAMQAYRIVAELDPSRRAANIAKAKEVLPMIQAYRQLQQENGREDTESSPYAGLWRSNTYCLLAGQVYWAFSMDGTATTAAEKHARGLAAVESEIIDKIRRNYKGELIDWTLPDPNSDDFLPKLYKVNIIHSGVKVAYSAVASAAAPLLGIDNALDLYISKYPTKWTGGVALEDSYRTSQPTDYPDIVLYIPGHFVSTAGMYAQAIFTGNTALAKEAVDWAVNFYDTYATHDSNNVSKLVASYSTYYTDSRTLRYTTGTGYLFASKLYKELGLDAEAINVLAKAKTYVDGTLDSLAKIDGYAVIGYYYKLYGDIATAQTMFNLAKAVSITGFTLDDTGYSKYYKGLAIDATIMGNASGAITLLSNAEPYAMNLTTTDPSSGIEMLTEIAYLYRAVDDINDTNMLRVLETAKAKAALITSASTKKSAYKYITNVYAKYGHPYLAYELVEALVASGDIARGDRASAINNAATKTLNRDNLPESSTAFLDLDKDFKPDFYMPWVDASEMTDLDDDIDGDGKDEDTDLTPFFND